MGSRAAVVGLFFGGTLAACTWLASCGARTGLGVDAVTEVDAEPDILDAAPDRRRDADADVIAEDTLPQIDVRRVDVTPPNDCPDAGSTLIYLISQQNQLMSFYPPTGEFRTIGLISCPAMPGDTPFSMAVDRKGIAYTVFSPNGQLFRVSTLTATCTPTTYVPGQSGFVTFGMGFVADTVDGGETLYVADTVSNDLATIDIKGFLLTVVGPTGLTGVELTGTGDGRLFAYWAAPMSTDSAIAQLDPATGQVFAQNPLPGVTQGGGWAFGFWGGSFYVFHAPGGTMTTTVVTRFNPADNSIVDVAMAPFGTTIVGAGVSTCAPSQ